MNSPESFDLKGASTMTGSTVKNVSLEVIDGIKSRGFVPVANLVLVIGKDNLQRRLFRGTGRCVCFFVMLHI